MMKIATTGTGSIVEYFIQAMSVHRDIECVCAYSRSAERATEFAKQCAVPDATNDWSALLNNPGVDFIYVASPNSLHYQQAKQALEAGKNVICEKPFTSTVAELSELIALAKQKKLFLFEAISVIHMPNFHEIHALLPALGKIKLVQCNYSQFSSKYRQFLEGKQPNVFNPEFSGGALMDINIYNIHFIHRLFGQPESVNYLANVAENGIDTSGIVSLRYQDFVASCVGAKDSNSINYAQIQGENGFLNVVHGVNGCQSLSANIQGKESTVDMQTQENRLTYELEVFERIFRQRDYQASYELLDHSLQVMTTLEKARKSAGVIFPADSEAS